MSGKIKKLNLKRFSPLIGLALFCAALAVLHRSAGTFRIHDVVAFVDALPNSRVAVALVLVLANFLLFGGYDLLALRYIGKRLPLRKAVGTAMLAFSFSNVVGGMVLGGGGIRYRSYESAGLSGMDVLRITLFIWVSWIVGEAAMVGISACAYPHLLDVLPWKHMPDLRWIGIPLCLAVAGYLFLAARGFRPLTLHGVEWPLPGLKLALGQLAVVAGDLLLSALILYLLLPNEAAIDYPRFAAVFILALALSLFSGIPGGLGVFEVLMLHLLKGTMPPSAILGALVVFRVVFYLVPLMVGAAVLGVAEARRFLCPLKPAGALAAGWTVRSIPQVFGAAVLVAGVAMLLTGTLPLPREHMEWLRRVLPLGVFELSHFMASIVGLLLVLFSRGLQRRQHGAYVSVLFLLGAGTVFEAVKGHAWLAATACGFLFAALLPCRKLFTRRSALLSEPFSLRWFLALCAVMGSAVWLVFFNYRHVEYANELWWRFSFDDNASRAMRATSGAMVLLLVFGIRRLLMPARPRSRRPDEADMETLRAIVAQSPSPTAALALLRDKAILFDSRHRSFLMYGVSGHTWVAMGDPVGEPEDFPELIWSFVEESDRHGGRAVFYQVGERNMGLYADVGFSFFKLGEEAVIPLEDFSLEGPRRAKMRYVFRRMQKQGFAFEVVPPSGVPGLLPRLREISDAWMERKAGKEKGFSLGRFDEAYLREFPMAIVRDGGGTPVAFANLWPGDGHRELSMDLMRHLPETPPGIMDFLFINLFLWGREQGYAAFNMGMAPLAGLDEHPLGPVWSRVGVWIFRNGEHFYNFQGLRRYKGKFDPQWRPRYLASNGGARLAAELLAAARLISGGKECR